MRNPSRRGSGALALVLAAFAVPVAAHGAEQGRPLGGRVVAWGDPNHGLTKIPAGLRDAVVVATSGSHALALRSDGTVVGWGDDSDGQAGAPAGLTEVTAIAAGPGYSLAVRSDGTLAGWGRARHGGPLAPPALTDRIIAVAAGYDHGIALRSDGTVLAWGEDKDGQTDVPLGLRDVVAVGAGGFYSAALRSDGTVVVWGYNVELGDVAAYPSPELGDSPTNPVRLVHGKYNGMLNTANSTGLLGQFKAIDVEYDHTVGLRADGTVTATGSRYNPGNYPPLGLDGVVAVATGSFHNIALRSDGIVVAWGGRRVPGSLVPSDDIGRTKVPTGLRNVTAIAAGGAFNLAITTAG